jgi:hypothetical protein
MNKEFVAEASFALGMATGAVMEAQNHLSESRLESALTRLIEAENSLAHARACFPDKLQRAASGLKKPNADISDGTNNL